MECTIALNPQELTPTIQVIGKLTRKDVRQLTGLIRETVKTGCPRIVLDMNATEYLDSYGIGALIYSWQILKAQNCDLAIMSDRPLIRELLKSTHLDKAFTLLSPTQPAGGSVPPG